MPIQPYDPFVHSARVSHRCQTGDLVILRNVDHRDPEAIDVVGIFLSDGMTLAPALSSYGVLGHIVLAIGHGPSFFPEAKWALDVLAEARRAEG